jgi:hypothetical protein
MDEVVERNVNNLKRSWCQIDVDQKGWRRWRENIGINDDLNGPNFALVGAAACHVHFKQNFLVERDAAHLALYNAQV